MKSRKIVLILVLSMLTLSIKNSLAQDNAKLSEVEQVKSELFEETAQISSVPNYRPQWQEDMITVQLQANNLMAQNIRLSLEQKTLQKEILNLEANLQDKQKKNRELRIKIGGHQALLDEKAWKTKTSVDDRRQQEDLSLKNSELKDYESKIKYLEQKIEVARLKLKLMGVEDNSDKLLAVQEERDILEAHIIGQREKEEALRDNIRKFRDERKPIDPAVAVLRDEIDALRKEIVALETKNKMIASQTGPTPEEQIRILTKQQEGMAIDNAQLKAKIDKYKKDQKMGIENHRIKNLVEAISAVDAANSGLTDEIGYLRENIAILKNRVKRLNRQAESKENVNNNAK